MVKMIVGTSLQTNRIPQKITPQYKNLPSRHVVLACRWAHLRRYWHGDAHTYVGLACRRAHLLFYYLLFFLSNLLFGIAGRRFSMSTGTLTSFWYVDWHTYYFTIYYSSFPTYFLASRGVVLACRRTLFWHVDGDNLVWHVDGNNLFGMLTRRILDDQGSLSKYNKVLQRFNSLYSKPPFFRKVLLRSKQIGGTCKSVKEAPNC